jgi:hypothetical protein
VKIQIKNKYAIYYTIKTLKFLNFSIFPGNGDSAGVEPEKAGYLEIGLSDFKSKTKFGNVVKFYIDHQNTSI